MKIFWFFSYEQAKVMTFSKNKAYLDFFLVIMKEGQWLNITNFMLLFSAEYNIVVFITNNKNAISYLTNLCLNLINLSISVSSLLAQLILNVTLKILCREIRSHDNNSQIDRNDKWKIFLEGNNPTKSYLPLRT